MASVYYGYFCHQPIRYVLLALMLWVWHLREETSHSDLMFIMSIIRILTVRSVRLYMLCIPNAMKVKNVHR